MCESEFVVPFRLDDLFMNSSRQYSVQEVYSKQYITVEVLQLKRSMYDDSDGFIFKHFDLYCNLIRQFKDFDESTLLTAFRVLAQVAEKMFKSLESLLEDEDEELDQDLCFTNRNILKMCIYLLCQLTNVYEEEILKKTIAANIVKGRRKKASVDDFESKEWPEERVKFLVIIKKLFRLPIKKLWSPPIIEHELINFVTNVFFKLLENADVARDKSVKMEIFRFLGTILIENRTGLAYSIRILQLVQDYEHLPNIMAEVVVYFVQECSADTLVSDICREATLLDMKTLTQNLTAAHSLSTFLTTICEKCPDKVLNIIGSLLQFLEWESHVMRNCTLSIMGTLLNKILANENLDEKQKNIREELLDKIETHLLDTNSFVRSKAIQVLKMLLDEKALASFELYRIGISISKRLRDKASNVRKNAMSFLAQFIKVNQFACQIPLSVLKESYQKESQNLKDMEKSRPVIFDDSDDDEPQGEKEKALIFDDSDEEGDSQKAKENSGNTEENENEAMVLGDAEQNQEKTSTDNSDILEKQALVAYLKNTLNFAEVIHGVVQPICTLLHSSTQTDVLEAIEFLTTASGSLVNGLEAGVREILNLVWSIELPIRDAALKAFKALYLTEVEEKRDVANIAKNLLLMLRNATMDDLVNLEAFVQHFCALGEIPASMSSILWTNFVNSDSSDEEKVSILILLGMIASVNPSFVLQNMNAIVERGLHPENSFLIAMHSLKVLKQINKNKRGKFDSIRPSDLEIRFPKDHIIAEKIKHLLIEGITNNNDDKWTPMANEAVCAIFALIEEPASLCSEITPQIADQLSRYFVFTDEANSEGTPEKFNVPSVHLSRFLSLCGHIALHYATYLKVDHFAVLRREELYREQRRRKSVVSASISTPKFSRVNGSPLRSKRRKSIQKEYKLIPPTDEETTYEQVLEMCAEEVQDETKLLGSLLPLVVGMCRQTLRDYDKDIQASASLSLAKFMLLGEKVCADNIQLLATITEKSPEPYIRANMIIALGDLSTSFPNIIEPWTSQLFNRLSDPDASVRESAIITLTHLILQDFVRVKSLISEAAKCLADTENNISDVAKFLFLELSKKGNIIYNIIPDIISSLSDPKADFSEEKFQVVLKHMLQYVEKEKLVEGLVEKLCYRFADSSTDIQLHELTFCLSILTLNDKCYSKLMEFKNFLKERMSDPVIMKYITNITANAKKNDAKTAAELETFRKELGL
ncbi:condensin complex subunit 1 [Parasteatoda tepidariorum]|nr:condensin complex subunit 1 [Parasteatoda tepidariorum]